MRKFIAGTAIAATGVALALLVVLALGHINQAQATNPPGTGSVVLGFDMDPYTTIVNDDTQIGPVDACISVPNTTGYTFDVDTFIDQVPAAPWDFEGAGYRISDSTGTLIAPGGDLTLTTQTHITGGINLITNAAGSGAPMYMLLDEAVPEPPDSAGNPGIHGVSFGDMGTAEPAGSVGVVGRYEFTVNAGAGGGIYGLTLSNIAMAGNGADWTSTITDILDGVAEETTGGADCADSVDNDGDGFTDGADADCAVWGLIAIGVPCPVPTEIVKESFGIGDYPYFGIPYPLGWDIDGDTVIDDPYLYGGNPFAIDNDGDGLINEDPKEDVDGDTVMDGVDNDSDGLVDEDPPDIPASQDVPIDLVEVVHNYGWVDEDPTVNGIDEDGDTFDGEDPIDGVNNDGDGPPELITVTITGTPPELCDVSYHASAKEYANVYAEGPPFITVTDGDGVVTVDPAVSTTYYAEFPDVLQVEKQYLLPVGVDLILHEDWDIHCAEASQHHFLFENEVEIVNPLVPEFDDTNNYLNYHLGVAVIGLADIDIDDMTISGPVGLLVDDGYDNDGDTLVDEDPINYVDDDGDGPWGGVGSACPGPGNVGCDEDGGTIVPVVVDKDIIVQTGSYMPVEEASAGPYTCQDGTDNDADGDIDGLDTDADTVVEDPECLLPVNIMKAAAVVTPMGTTHPTCTLTPVGAIAAQELLEENVILTHSETFYLQCGKCGFEVDDDGDNEESGQARFSGSCTNVDGFNIPIDDDGDGLANDADPDCNINIDEDFPGDANEDGMEDGSGPVTPGTGDCNDGIDNDTDTFIDEDDPDCAASLDDDGDGFADEDGPVCLATVVVFDLVTPKDPHVLDADLGETGCDPYDYTTWPYCDPTPGTFGDGNGGMVKLTVPGYLPFNPSFEAITDDANPANTTVHPAGGFDDDCLVTLDCKRQFDFDLLSGNPLGSALFIQPPVLSLTHGLAVTTGDVVGQVKAVTGLGFLGGPCTTLFNIDIPLYDCPLPAAMGEGPNDVDDPGTTDPTEDGDFDGLGAFLPTYGSGWTYASWSSQLNAIVGMIDMADGTLDGVPTLHMRKCGLALPTGVPYPINVLVFEDTTGATTGAAGSWVELTIIGAPDNDLDLLYDALDPDDDGDTIPDALDPDSDGDGTLNNEEAITSQCTPYQTALLELGESSGGTTLATCDVLGLDWPMAAKVTRADVGTSSMHYDTFDCTGESDVEIEKSDELFPVVPVSIPTPFDVDISVTNGSVPDDVNVEMSIVSGPKCEALWVAESLDVETGPMIIGIRTWHKLSFVMAGMTAGENRTDSRTYMLTCSEPVTAEDIQIIVNAASASAYPDPDILNNQKENHPQASASVVDSDGDTIPNADDNCPWIPNSDQLDTDGDGLGDACDLDDDDDTVLDVDDACPLTPEDMDGVDDDDGCPETDVNLLVVPQGDLEVNVSEDTTFTVTATACNTDYPALLRFNELLKSEIGGCEARWIPLPGDDYVEDVVDTDGDTVADELISQLEVVMGPVNPYNCVEKVREYVVHCPDKCLHYPGDDYAIFLEESVVPVYPVMDPYVSNQVDKQYIDVIAWANADIKVLEVSVESAPDEMRLVEDVNGDSVIDERDTPAVGDFVVKKVLHNNGPYSPAHVQPFAYYNAIVPDDCVATLTSAPSDVDLDASVTVSIFEYWTIECTEPSDHEFTFENCVETAEEHLRDPNPDNNCGSASVTVPVIGKTNVAIQQDVNSVAHIDVSEDVLFTVDKIIQNQGAFAVTPDIAQVMTPPADCELSYHFTNAVLAQVDEMEIACDGVVIDPPTPAGWEASDTVWCGLGETLSLSYQAPLAKHQTLNLSEEFDKHCMQPCDHEFSLTMTVSRDAARDPHVEFAGSQETDTWPEEVWADADLKILDWFFMDLTEIASDVYKVLVPPHSWADGHQKEVIHNEGPFGPVDVLKTIDAVPTEGCAVGYNVKGDEAAITIMGTPITPPPPGADVYVQWPDMLGVEWVIPDLAVSVDHWQAELWGFHIDDHVWECNVDFVKTLEGPGGHVRTVNATASKAVVVCADTDEDGVPDQCLGEQDNCPLVPNPDQTDTDGDGLGDACDPTPSHDVVVKYCLKFGPAPVNISDAQGKYMWTICEIGNASNHTETVAIDLDVTAPALGCTMYQELILPGQTTFLMLSGEQKFVLWRNYFECHSPAVQEVYTMTVTACIDHVDHTVGIDDDSDGAIDEDPVDGVDNDTDSLVDEDPPEGDGPPDCEEQFRNMIVHDPTP